MISLRLVIILLPSTLAILNQKHIDIVNSSDVAIALSEIINGLNPSQLAILTQPTISGASSLNEDVNGLIYQLHKRYFKSLIFYDFEIYFKFIENSIKGSIESFSLIFFPPYELSQEIQKRNLSHRLSLFIFYWGAKQPPSSSDVQFEEPIRAVIITRPRQKAFRIYYNQAVPNGVSNLKLVNWFDAENLGLYKTPLLPSALSVYSNFGARILRVPVLHSPPWFWVNYENDTQTMDEYTSLDYVWDETELLLNVTGGRDHRLLTLIAKHMNFEFKYIDAPSRTQGSLKSDDENNLTFTGAIGLLQRRAADLLLGDVGLSWERRKAVEFSFFTLADSGAFATHAPRRLNEALAIVRPFRMDVWPYLILTVLLSGPLLYFVIVIPYKWQSHFSENDFVIYEEYLMEITPSYRGGIVRKPRNNEIPKNLFHRCIWFTVQLFLKQSCHEPHQSRRAKFLMIVYCIAATYVLADVYSAQLTSQFARPAREASINNLEKLQEAMSRHGYQLYVEKESSSLEMLENGTEIFRNLYALMKQQQQSNGENGYLIDSVEAGIKMVTDGFQNKVVFGGRETLYFNMRQFGSKAFQLSQKLYTRYSAVAVQIGCPFLDSLNDVLIHLFEGGILDKMTSAEYETLSRLIVHKNSRLKTKKEEYDASAIDDNDKKGNSKTTTGDSFSSKAPTSGDGVLIMPINLRMLQGAFIALICGQGIAGLILLLEVATHRKWIEFHKNWESLKKQISQIRQSVLNALSCWLLNILRSFVNGWD